MSDLLGQDFSDSPVSIELAARACRKEATCVSHTPRCVFSIQLVYSPGIIRQNSAVLDSHSDVLMFGLGGDFSIHGNRLSVLAEDQCISPGSSGNENIFAIDAQPVHRGRGRASMFPSQAFSHTSRPMDAHRQHCPALGLTPYGAVGLEQADAASPPLETVLRAAAPGLTS